MENEPIQRFEPVPPQYAKSVIHGDTVYLAGLIADNWDLDITGQSREIFNEVDELLASAGSSKSKILFMQVFIATFEDYAKFKEAFAQWIDPGNLPARATVQAELLDPKLKIEITTIAAR